jgi:hypothetical protein
MSKQDLINLAESKNIKFQIKKILGEDQITFFVKGLEISTQKGTKNLITSTQDWMTRESFLDLLEQI